MDPFSRSGSSPQEFESKQSPPAVDLRFENHLSLFLIRHCSETGQHWLDANVGDEDTLTFRQCRCLRTTLCRSDSSRRD